MGNKIVNYIYFGFENKKKHMGLRVIQSILLLCCIIIVKVQYRNYKR